jgi:hypothetical protein
MRGLNPSPKGEGVNGTAMNGDDIFMLSENIVQVPANYL